MNRGYGSFESPLEFVLKAWIKPNMHIDPFFVLFPVLIECQRWRVAVKSKQMAACEVRDSLVFY